MATIIEYINPLLKGENLSFEQATSLLDIVFEGEVPEAQIAAFLTAMRIKGPTAQEVAGLARSLRSHAVKVEPGIDNLVDVVGTGVVEPLEFDRVGDVVGPTHHLGLNVPTDD